MASSDPVVYEQGDALEDILSPQKSGDGRAEASSADDLATHSEVYELSEEEYWEWLASLMQEGRELDEYLDDLLEEIYAHRPPFYSWSGRRELRALFDELHEARTSVRAFERDVEQLSYVFTKSDKIETQAAENADIPLSNLEQTYDRAYDLCMHKLDRISNAWITATNLLISITILVVTILFWMEFW